MIEIELKNGTPTKTYPKIEQSPTVDWVYFNGHAYDPRSGKRIFYNSSNTNC